MKQEINHFRELKHTQTRRLNNMLLNDDWINNETKEDIKRYLETNENESTTTPNLWDTRNAVLRGQFIAPPAYLKKQKSS